MLDRLFVGAEDRWSWVHNALGKVDQEVFEAIDAWGLLDGDEYRRGDLLLLFVPAGGDPAPAAMVWGVPRPWVPGNSLLHTIQSETALSEPPWTDWLGVGRCVVPVSAYTTREQPGARVRLRSGEGTALAALCGPDPTWAGQYGCAILTAPAGDDLSPRHQRQPVILSDYEVRRWLDPAIRTRERVRDLLRPLKRGSLVVEAVSVG